MLFRRLKKVHYCIIIGLIILLVIISLYNTKKGTILIIEDSSDLGFSVQMSKYNSEKKYQLYLSKGDMIQVDVKHTEGIMALTVNGESGSEPYTGNDLKTGIFTFRVSETDNYLFWFKGSSATGTVIIKNLK
jgi:hypothetical protein